MLLAVHQATREATQDTTEVIPLDEIAQKSFSKQISNDSQDYDEEMMSRVQTRDDGQITGKILQPPPSKLYDPSL
jgi:hypothetical protein